MALRTGVSRGVFTNEAGMGTAAIAYSSAKVSHPVKQGLMGIMEVFLDTIVICTMTALVILCSGIPIPYGQSVGAELTAQAFSAVLGDWSSVFLTLALSAFAFATVLGWGLYGARCAQFLLGASCWKYFALLQTAVVAASALLETGVIWSLAELVNGLMAIPNLIALVALGPKLKELTIYYKLHFGGYSAGGGTYENFNQCQSMPALSYAKVPSLRGGSEASGQENLSPEHWPA
jgi:AGCS family alanine or glycine:cation symporter